MGKLKIINGKTGGALKTVLYGPEGIGKSTFAARFPRLSRPIKGVDKCMRK